MEIVEIKHDNLNLIVNFNKIEEKRDKEFLNALWKYVLFSKEKNRKLTLCKKCKEKSILVFDGLGGIKKVGTAYMYIPVGNKLYEINDIIFHSFFIHKLSPTLEFENAVINGPKPEEKEYTKIIEKIYGENPEEIWAETLCWRCGKTFIGIKAFDEGKANKDVDIYKINIKKYSKYIAYKFIKKFNKEKIYKNEPKEIGICFNCYKYTPITLKKELV